MTVYHHANGLPSKYPTDQEFAMNVKSSYYDDGVKCPTCEVMSVKYTHDKSCRWCVRQRAIHLYNLSVGSDLVYINTETGRAMAKIARSTDVEIPSETFSRMLELVDIAKSDNAFTVSTEPCKTKPHFGLKRYGKCYECELEKNKPTVRQVAISKGENWYIPSTPCPRCETRSERHVYNGSCRGCSPVKHDTAGNDDRSTPDSIMMHANPDMILSREDARAYDMKVYRTGQKCKHGHDHWRYVSTGNCITCLRTKDSE